MDGLSLEESLSGIDPILFEQFREKTADLHCPLLEKDQYVARWLKARNWDVEKAEKMFRMHLKWREELKLDEVLASFEMPEVIEKYFPGGICGQDKFGRPAFICPAGTTDVVGLMRSASRSQLALSRYYVMERIVSEVLPAQSRRVGRPVDQLVVLFDLQHMNRRQLWRPWLNFVLEMTSIFEVNFPELMAVCFVLNAPSFFSMIFSLLKPLLSRETQDKIHILGSNYQDELLRLFNPEDLPVHYGGTMRDPDGDPRCPSRICWGGPVPESYYQIQVAEDGSGAAVDDAFQLVPVGRGSKEYCYLGEAKTGDVVSWEFYTEANDIAFSLWMEPTNHAAITTTSSSSPPTSPSPTNEPSPSSSRRRSIKSRSGANGGGGGGGNGGGGGMSTSFSFNNLLGGANKLDLTQVTHPVRVDCDLVPEVGKRKVDKDGSYYLLFDNSYSWTRAKRVFCKSEVTRCDEANGVLASPTVNGNSSNCVGNEGHEDKMVDRELSEVMKAVCAPGYSGLSTLDIDLTALVMVLLRTLPILRRRNRRETPSPKSPPSPSSSLVKQVKITKRPVVKTSV